MSFKRKDLLGLAALSSEEIALLLEAAEPFKEVSGREIKKVPALRGKTVVNLFFEPSTRTRNLVRVGCKTVECRRGEFFTVFEQRGERGNVTRYREKYRVHAGRHSCASTLIGGSRGDPG